MQRQRGKNRRWRGIISTALAVCVVLSLFIYQSFAENIITPAIFISGAEIRMVQDENGDVSAQAIVDVSVMNVEMLSGININMDVNTKYLTPSRFETNEPYEIKSGSKRISQIDSINHFVQYNEAFEGIEPYLDYRNLSSFAPTTQDGYMQVSMRMSPATVKNEQEREAVNAVEGLGTVLTGYGDENEGAIESIYINAKEGVSRADATYIFSMSFSLDLDNISAMYQGFHDLITEDGYSDREGFTTDFILRWIEIESMLAEYHKAGNLYAANPITTSETYRRFIWNFADDLVDVRRPVADDVVINAYQGYTYGNASDLIVALQRYSPTVRGTYAAGWMTDFVMLWGGNEGVYITREGSNERYLFQWKNTGTAPENYNTAVYADGYNLWRVTESGKTLVTDESALYDPRGGTYQFEQPFYYLHEEQVREATVPIKVTMQVTPVTAIGVVADRERISYINDGGDTESGTLPLTYDGLNLPREARIITDVVTGKNDFVMAIQSWNPPRQSAAVVDQLSHVKGENAADQEVIWTNRTDDANVGVYPFAGSPVFGETNIRAVYPWMTVAITGDAGKVEVEREILPADGRPTVTAEGTLEFEVVASELDANDHRANMRLELRRLNEKTHGEALEEFVAGGGAEGDFRYEKYTSLPTGTLVSLRLPGGQIVENAWFGTDGSSYSNTLPSSTEYRQDSAGATLTGGENEYRINASLIQLKAGETTAADSTLAQREIVRRAINLGGYFAVQVEMPENGSEPARTSDWITFYLAPRKNYHLADYIRDPQAALDATNRYFRLFDYTGLRAKIYPYYGSQLPEQFTLPYGDSVMTRYDGITGAERGYSRAFQVDSWNLTPIVGKDNAFTTGATLFSTKYLLADYGWLQNAAVSPHSTRSATLWVERQMEEDGTTEITKPYDPTLERFTITYEGRGDKVTLADDGVDKRLLVEFTPKTEGYTSRQEVVLTITNTGEVPLRGLHIDLNGFEEFTVVKQPATDLPVGGKTTFTLSYIYDLKLDYSGAEPADKEYNTYPNRTNPQNIIVSTYYTNNTNEQRFNATFTVTKEERYRVNFELSHMDYPEEKGYGATANVVVGQQPDYFYAESSVNSYLVNEDVYVMVTPDENSQVVEVYYYINNVVGEANKVVLPRYPVAGSNPDDHNVPDGALIYQFPQDDELDVEGMPPYDVTVYVVMQETLRSRLRLDDLIVLSGPGYESEKTERQKYDPSSYDPLDFDMDIYEYLAVLPYEDDYAQIRLKLREVLDNYPENYPEISIHVPALDINVLDFGPDNVPEGEEIPKEHTSRPFDTPVAPNQRLVEISLTAYNTVVENEDGTYTKSDPVTVKYTVILVRRPQGETVIHTLNAGNSPYGMIANSKLTAANKVLARERFVQNGYLFDFSNMLTTPEKADGLNLTYWPQAWADGTNWDLNEEILFIYEGEMFRDPGLAIVYDSAGAEVLSGNLKRTLEELVLLPDESNQALRFDTPAAGSERIISIALTEQHYAEEGGEPKVKNPSLIVDWWKNEADEAYAIRPGLYLLRYSFEDFDHTEAEPKIRSVTRPVMILPAVGDVLVNYGATGDQQAHDAANADAIAARMELGLGFDSTSYAEGMFFRYRVADVNNDQNINNIDRNTLLSGTETGRYYKPVDYINN